MIGQTQIQLEVWNRRLLSQSYDQIMSAMSAITSHHMIATCLRRTALGQTWYPHFMGGTDKYLCDQDSSYLVEYLCDNAHCNNCLRTFEVQDAAHSLKIMRHHNAIRSLISMNCRNIASEISTDIEPPSRSWINDFCLQHSFTLKNVQELDRNRYKAGYEDDLKDWLLKIAQKVLQVPPELIFNSDETMISGKRVYKGITDGNRAIAQENMVFAHMTAMITINAAGIKVPPYIILSGLMNFPNSLQCFNSLSWFGSSANGWMTKNLFLSWSINFVHWLTHYRASLPTNIQNAPCLLYLDGHMTRLNPAAIDYMKKHNIIVIIFPSHVSHILQPFDVGCASPLKSMFKKLIIQFSKKIPKDGRSFADYMRLVCVSAFLEAADRTLTMTNSKMSFQRAGLFPFNPCAIKNNPYVIQGRNPEPIINRVYTCSGKIITEDEELRIMYNAIINRRNPFDITLRFVDPYFTEFQLRNFPLNEGRQLSRFHSKLIMTQFGYQILKFE